MWKLSLLVLAAVGFAHAAPAVDRTLLHQIQSQGSANVVLTLTHGSARSVLSHLENKVYANRNERLNTVTQTLISAAIQNQADILQFLKAQKSESTTVKAFWITNKIVVRGIDAQLYKKLLTRSDLAEIRLEKIIPLNFNAQIDSSVRAGPEPNIIQIRAPEVWANHTTGTGAVVATIDTGVRATHEALAGNHRVDHGWFDPEESTGTANDNLGHGTHVMGILAGQNGIGVAPGTQWIACKGCGASCTELALIACGQWALCPSDAEGNNLDCSKAPHVVSNSWGGGQANDFFDDTLHALRNGGVLPIFASSGSGPACSSIGSPADSAYAVAVGAVDATDKPAEFTGSGPSMDGRVKPDVVAPGVNINSAFSTDDQSYARMTGSSMSAPHAAGVVALLVGKNPTLTVRELEILLKFGAVPTLPSGGPECGGIPETDYPNNKVGHGRVDAAFSVGLVPEN